MASEGQTGDDGGKKCWGPSFADSGPKASESREPVSRQVVTVVSWFSRLRASGFPRTSPAFQRGEEQTNKDKN